MTRHVELGLPAGWGRAVLRPSRDAPAPGSRARSHDDAGTSLDWIIPLGSAGRFACDLERASAAPRPQLQAILGRGGGADFLDAWVLAEVAAKLLDIPILEWLHLHRSGRTPRLPRTAGALVLPRVVGNRRVALAFAPQESARPPGRPAVAPPHSFGFDTGRVHVWNGPLAEAVGPAAETLEDV